MSKRDASLLLPLNTRPNLVQEPGHHLGCKQACHFKHICNSWAVRDALHGQSNVVVAFRSASHPKTADVHQLGSSELRQCSWHHGPSEGAHLVSPGTPNAKSIRIFHIDWLPDHSPDWLSAERLRASMIYIKYLWELYRISLLQKPVGAK